MLSQWSAGYHSFFATYNSWVNFISETRTDYILIITINEFPVMSLCWWYKMFKKMMIANNIITQMVCLLNLHFRNVNLHGHHIFAFIESNTWFTFQSLMFTLYFYHQLLQRRKCLCIGKIFCCFYNLVIKKTSPLLR